MTKNEIYICLLLPARHIINRESFFCPDLIARVGNFTCPEKDIIDNNHSFIHQMKLLHADNPPLILFQSFIFSSCKFIIQFQLKISFNFSSFLILQIFVQFKLKIKRMIEPKIHLCTKSLHILFV